MTPRLILVSATLAFLTGNVAPALACACCTEKATRSIGTVALDESAPQRTILDELRFARTARLRQGPEDMGLDRAANRLTFQVRRGSGRFTFLLRDLEGRSGTLSWRVPATLSYFTIDPDPQDPDPGTGPVLYMEWTLKAPGAGSGIFKAAGPGSRMTLILHDRGGACTEAGDFHAWTLEVEGRSTSFALYGGLASRRR